MRLQYIIHILAFLLYCNAKAQMDTTIFYLRESFEQTSPPWESLPVDPDIKWIYQQGGNDQSPEWAFHGSKNAFLWHPDWENPSQRLLLSPIINLGTSVKPLLTFYHAQFESFDGNDDLTVLFRTSPTASWDTIAKFTQKVEYWAKRTFLIDQEGAKFLTSQFQIGLLGTTRGGNGVCLDSISIQETAVINRYVGNVSASDVVHSVVPSGVRQLPVFRIEFEVLGNNSTLSLDSLVVRSLSTDNSVFDNSGFRLYLTQDDYFRNSLKGVSTQLGSTTGISGGIIRFSNLGKALKTGQYYLWVCADIKPGDIHNKVIDFRLDANSLHISGSKFPSATISPAGSNTIEAAIFYDNFDSDKGWSLNFDFEREIPQGKVVGITADPDFAYSGSRVLGTDLTNDGAYLPSIDSASAYFAVTPSMNMKYYDFIKLSMKKWIAFRTTDIASIELSTDGGTLWQPIWNSQVSGQNVENMWNDLVIGEAVNNLVRRESNVRFRFGIWESIISPFVGWNIDNFAVTGEHLTSEVGITRMILPCSDCKNTGFDTVRVVVRNYAALPTPATIPIFYSLNGKAGPKIYDTIKVSIPVDDSIVFTFKNPANFPAPGNYNFLVATQLAGDQYKWNDSVYTEIKIQDNIAPPKLVDFETGEGYWVSGGIANTWICKVPDESIGQVPGSPTAWILSPFGLYADNDESFLISSCYNLAGADTLVLEMKYTNISQAGHDGANIQYTTNDGASWNVLQNNPHGFDWNWYTNNVLALGANGWSGNSDGWRTARTILPASLLTQPRVKFRVFWAADSITTDGGRGIALDDFGVFPAPPDVGIDTILTPSSDCRGSNSGLVSVMVKNDGLNAVPANDTVVLGYQLDALPVVYDTLFTATAINPGASAPFTFSLPVDLDQVKAYTLKVFSLYDADPWFYSTNNDTLMVNLQIFPQPITSLPDTIRSREPDTLVIRAYHHANYTYNWDNGASLADTIKVSASDRYYRLWIEDTYGNGCHTNDSVYVELLFNDVGISRILSPVSSCELSATENIMVEIKNYGNDDVYVGATYQLGYELDGGTPVVDSYTLTEHFKPGHVMSFTFAGQSEDFTAIKDYQLKAYIYFGGDTIRTNDTLVQNIQVFGYPTVDLGPDKTVQAVSHQLDASPGFTTYLWGTGDTTQTYVVDTTGFYHIVVTDTNGCPARDTVFIRLKIRDVSPGLLLNPVSGCSLPGDFNVMFQAINSGTDTIPEGNKIYFNYRRGDGPIRSDSVTLASQLLPGTAAEKTFTQVENINSHGDYPFTLTTTTPGDLISGNDERLQVVQIHPQPVVNFGFSSPHSTTADSLVLNPGYNAFYSYLWQDNSTIPTYIAYDEGNYSVTATDTRTGCLGSGNIYVVFLFKDVGIVSVDLPTEPCSQMQNVRVGIRNLGNTSLPIGTTIDVECRVNGQLMLQETRVLTSAFNFGTTINHVFDMPLNIGTTLPANVKFYTIMADDKYATNDTLVRNYGSVKLSPPVNFGDIDGLLKVSFPHTLDAGVSQPSYLWDNGSTNRTRTVTIPGTYSVTVTAVNSCKTFKSVLLQPLTFIREQTFKPIEVSLFPNPATDYFIIEIDAREHDNLMVDFFSTNGTLLRRTEVKGGQLYQDEYNVNLYPQGIYLIKIYNSEVNYTGRVVVY